MQNKKIEIALADDHTIVRKGIKGIIESYAEFDVTLDVSNGRQLIEALSIKRQLPDICVLDINMPEMNGYETAKKLKQLFPQIKILALSMYDNEYNIVKWC